MPRTPKRGWEYPPGSGELLQKIFDSIDSDVDEALSTAASSHHIISPTHDDVVTTGSVSTGDVLYWNGSSWMPKNIGSNFVYSSASLNLTNVSATMGSAGISLSVAAPSGGDTTKFMQAWELEGSNTAGQTSATQGSKLYLEGGNRVTISGTSNTLILSVKDSDLFLAGNSSNLMNTSERAALQYTSATSNITSAAFAAANSTNLLNTSQSSLFQQTSATSAVTSNAMNTSERTNYMGSTERSNFIYASASLNLTNISATLGSNTISLSVGNYITTGMASDAGSLFMQTTERTNLQYTSATSAITSAAFPAANSSNLIATANSSLFQHTSATSAITSNALNTSQSSLFQSTGAYLTTAMQSGMTSAFQYTSATSAITSNALNTSQSSLFQHTSATSAITSAAFPTANSSNLVATANSSLFQHTSATSAITSNAANTSVTSKFIQAWELSGGSAGTQSSLQGSKLYLYGDNNMIISGSGNTLAFSVVVSNLMPLGMSTDFAGSSVASRVIGIAGSGASTASGVVQFQNSNSVTFGLNGNTITAQVNPARVISLNGTSGSMSLYGASNVTVSNNGSAITMYGPASVLYGVSVSGNTGTTGSSAVANSGFVLAGGNNVTLSQSNNTISIYAATPGGVQTGISGIGVSNTTYTSGTVILSAYRYVTIETSVDGASQYARFIAENPGVVQLNGTDGSVSISGASNITASNNGGTVTIYGRASQLWAMSIGGNSGTTNSSNLANTNFLLAGGANITLNQSNNTISISGHAAQTGISGIAGSAASTVTAGTVQFSNANSISFGLNGSTMTASYMQWLSSYDVVRPQWYTGLISFQTASSGAMSLWGFQIPHGVLADHLAIVASMNYDGTGQSSYRQSGTLAWGLYTRPTAAASTQLDSITSSSFSYGVTFNSNTLTISHPATTRIGGGDYTYLLTSSAGVNLTTLFTGLKVFWLNLQSSMTPGQYWLGLHHRNISNSHNYGIRMSLHGPSQTLTGLLPFGRSNIQTSGTDFYAHWAGPWMPFGGASYTIAGLTNVGSRISISQMSGDLSVYPYIRLESRITA